ncbi:MAG: bifunctional methionine sulfoxide reductase B/A protein [Bacteroidia bacterium]|nr:bifunctional methionine sulfoxide reductase B/A protein [Bacteroidia bacterium]
MKLNPLTENEKHVILDKGTERPFTGEYTDDFEKGTYICKQCDNPLYQSSSKFHSGCGWPSFDDEIKDAVKKLPDADGRRTEIVCAKCGGHLGHVFYGEGFTNKDTRHCVNSISMKFVPEQNSTVTTQKAIFAGGCFWGVEYYFQHAKGVIKTQVGYIGGTKDNPTYKEVCSHTTGHVEAMEIVFDPIQTTYEELAKLFFEIHDPTQTNGQGNDIGPQYLSEIFYFDAAQKETAEKLINQLETKGNKIATKLRPVEKFWPAEDYHQQYYEKGGGTPYCHKRVSRF